MAPESSVLALLSPVVAQCPAGPHSNSSGSRNGAEVLKMFGVAHSGSISIHFGDTAALRYNNCGSSKRQFASCDDVFCVFTGFLQNLSQLRLTYGLSKNRISEANLVIEMYRALRDRAPFPVSQALAEFKGSFSFVLYDNRDKTALIAMDCAGKYPLYWGTCQDGTVALSDDVDVLRQGCSSSFAPFPTGCFFSTASGLKSFEHPSLGLRPVPHVDSTGNVCGSKYEVDPLSQLEVTHHVGSFHDLSAL